MTPLDKLSSGYSLAIKTAVDYRELCQQFIDEKITLNEYQTAMQLLLKELSDEVVTLVNTPTNNGNETTISD